MTRDDRNMKAITIETTQPRVAVDVTDRVAGALEGDGLRQIAVPHTTCALILSEADDDLLRDIEQVSRTLLAGGEPFRHAKNDNPNAAAHIMSSLFGTSLLLRVEGGRPLLGTYQRIVLVELDGPKTRTINVDDVKRD